MKKISYTWYMYGPCVENEKGLFLLDLDVIRKKDIFILMNY